MTFKPSVGQSVHPSIGPPIHRRFAAGSLSIRPSGETIDQWGDHGGRQVYSRVASSLVCARSIVLAIPRDRDTVAKCHYKVCLIEGSVHTTHPVPFPRPANWWKPLPSRDRQRDGFSSECGKGGIHEVLLPFPLPLREIPGLSIPTDVCPLTVSNTRPCVPINEIHSSFLTSAANSRSYLSRNVKSLGRAPSSVILLSETDPARSIPVEFPWPYDR